MNCKNCPLNIDSKFFDSNMITKIPLHFRNIFICNNQCIQKSNHNSLCGKDLWVLTFIGQKDKFAIKNAVTTMTTLVEKGFSELLCNLFENAPYETRRRMWQKMTTQHSDRLYMFDALFEKQCLAPIKDMDFADAQLPPYHNCVMFPNLAFETA